MPTKCRYHEVRSQQCGNGCAFLAHFPAANEDKKKSFDRIVNVFGIDCLRRLLLFGTRNGSSEDEVSITRSLDWEASSWERNALQGPFTEYADLQKKFQDLMEKCLELSDYVLNYEDATHFEDDSDLERKSYEFIEGALLWGRAKHPERKKSNSSDNGDSNGYDGSDRGDSSGHGEDSDSTAIGDSTAHGRHKEHVAYLRKQLESKHMEGGDCMEIFLTEIKDLKEQGNPDGIEFDELVAIFLHEDQFRQKSSKQRVADQAFAASQRGNANTSMSNRPKAVSSKSNAKSEKVVEKFKKNL